MKLIKRNWMPIALIILGLATRFAFIWWPNEIVFDEVHSGKIIASYFTGEFSFFDVHPPLGKLLVVLALWFRGSGLGFDFANIGEGYGVIPYITLRFLPNLFGALIPLIIFWLARELNFSKLAAFSAGLFLVLDNALITHSHFLVFDAFMLFFGLAGLAAFFRARNKSYNFNWLILAGLLIGSSLSSKWAGLAFLSAALLTLALDNLAKLIKTGASFFRRKSGYAILKEFFALVAVPAIVYVSVFAIHFELITKPGSANAFLSPEFQSRNFYGKLIELNRAMYTVNAGILAPHPYSSKPYTWPLVLRSVYYWNKSSPAAVAPPTIARIYLLGNPAVWWGSTFFGLLALVFWWPRASPSKKWLPVWLWLISMLPFIFVERTLFLYHYFTALIAAVMLAAGWLGDAPQKRRRIKTFTLYAALAAALAGFVYFAPLTYGFYLTEAAFKSRLWLPGWL